VKQALRYLGIGALSFLVLTLSATKVGSLRSSSYGQSFFLLRAL
jgi:hypothetical protein